MPTIFHHLKVPNQKPTAWVKVKDVIRWLAEIGKTEITVNGKKQSLSGSGSFASMDDELITEEHSWEVSRGTVGWIIARGTVTPPFSEERIPKIGGVQIAPTDPDDGPWKNPPQLAFRNNDGVIAIEANFSIEHLPSDGPYDGTADNTPPFYVYASTWLDWPRIYWLDQIRPTLEIETPNNNTLTEITVAIPIARVTAGQAYPLRSTNVYILGMINSAIGAK